MTEQEALDEAARAAGWRDWKTLQLIARPDKQDDIRRHAKTIVENAALKAEIERLREALVQHNDRLRSAAAVAGREGKETNWLSFRGQVHYTLAEYHELVNEARAALKEIEGD